VRGAKVLLDRAPLPGAQPRVPFRGTSAKEPLVATTLRTIITLLCHRTYSTRVFLRREGPHLGVNLERYKSWIRKQKRNVGCASIDGSTFDSRIHTLERDRSAPHSLR
jgi:hypothetical protein